MHFLFGRIVLEMKNKPVFMCELKVKDANGNEVEDIKNREYTEEYENVSDTANEVAFEHYREMIAKKPRFEVWLISQWSKEDTPAGRAVKAAIEERIAIREVEGIPTDLESALMCRFDD